MWYRARGWHDPASPSGGKRDFLKGGKGGEERRGRRGGEREEEREGREREEETDNSKQDKLLLHRTSKTITYTHRTPAREHFSTA